MTIRHFWLLIGLAITFSAEVSASGAAAAAAAAAASADERTDSHPSVPVMADGFVVLNSFDWVNHNRLTWVCVEAPRSVRVIPPARRESCSKWVSPQDYINRIAHGRPLVFSGLGVNTGTNDVVLYYTLDRSALPPDDKDAAPNFRTGGY